MNSEPKISPPKWAAKLLSWYCKPDLLEDLQGDLNEYFNRNLKSKGARRAKLIYIIDVFKFFRFYTVRKPEVITLLINWLMIRSYVKTSGRNMVRNKLFTFINVFGLAVSMSVGLVLISVLTDIFSYDKFHVNHSRIYRLISRYQYLDNKNNFNATTSLKAGKLIQQNFSGVEKVAIFRQNFSMDFGTGEKIVPLKGYWANNEVFEVFSFYFVRGNPAAALKQPYTMILTETSAKKLFGEEDALGKVVSFSGKDQFTVTGVVKDIPHFSHIKFEVLCSMSSNEKQDSESAWDEVWDNWVYVLLPANVDTKNFKANLDKLSAQEDANVKHTHIELALQPMDKIMFSEGIGNQIGPVIGTSMIWVFGGLALVVILSACFNYTNLSIARALRRTREIGIRKIIGAQRSQVMAQFIVEAILISICSLGAALLMFLLLRPYFLSLIPQLQKIFTLQITPVTILYFLVFAIFIGIAAGVLPSLFFARVQALSVLHTSTNGTLFKKLTLRRALVVIQFTISIILVTVSIGVYRQYRHFVAFDLGYDTENILNVALQGNKGEVLKKELFELPEVKEISQSAFVTSLGSFWGATVVNPTNPTDSLGVAVNFIDENYLSLHRHKFLAGRNFSAKPDSTTETEIIVTRGVLKRLNIHYQNPSKVIGEQLKVYGKKMQIVGVIEDFHYTKANENFLTKEVVFRYNKKRFHQLNIKLQSRDLVETYAKIKSVWNKIDPVHPFDAKFYDDQIDQSFSEMNATVKLGGFLGFLAISIASLGLLGMVVFTTETRIKEVGIRKVLGASEGGLLVLLGRNFLLLLLISAMTGLPITVVLFERIIFPETPNHAPLNLQEMVVGVVGVMTLALFVILLQTLKVARTNPATVLKKD